jgi:hypothetical protein
VVPITELGYAGEALIVESGTPPDAMPVRDPLPIELVGVGDHLLIQAESLEQPGSAAARDLRLFVLHRTFATMPTHSGTGRFVAPLARVIRGAVREHSSGTGGDGFTAILREVGHFLVASGDSRDLAELTGHRDALVRRLGHETSSRQIHPGPETVTHELLPADSAESVADDDVVPIALLAPDEDETDIVFIEALAPEPDDERDVVPIALLAPDADDESDVIPIAALAPDGAPAGDRPGRLERGYRRRDALIRTQGLGEPSLDALVGDGVVPVDDLLYRGSRAMARAEEIRGQLSGILAEPTVALERLRPRHDELFDLMPLARDAA